MNESKITLFRGPYGFLSNFWLCEVPTDRRTFNSVEVAFQASKYFMTDAELFQFSRLSPVEAKRAGRSTVGMSADWYQQQDQIMYKLVKSKFMWNKELARQLLYTGEAELIEGNTWGDTYWGVCNGVGENRLGRILMQVRNDVIQMRATLKEFAPENQRKMFW